MRAIDECEIDELPEEALSDELNEVEVENKTDTPLNQEWVEYPVMVSTLPHVEASGRLLDVSNTTWREVLDLYEYYTQNMGPSPVHSFVEFEGGRKKEHAIRAHGVIVEIDEARWSLDEVERNLRQLGLCGIVYTTKSHTAASPRFRVVLPLGQPVPADRYERIVRHVDAVILGCQADTSGRRTTQFQQFPLEGAEIRVVNGQPLDPCEVPGGAEGGKPLIPDGLRLFPPQNGPQLIGPVTACAAPDLISALWDPSRVNSLCEIERVAAVLDQVCVMEGDAFWVCLKNRKWVGATQKTALSLLKEHWSRINHVKIEGRLIEEVFRRSLLPVVSGVLVSPVASEWVEYHGMRYLNLGLASRLAPSEFGEDGRLLVEFVNRNICADERPAEEIEREVINSNDSSSTTRWVWHWLAHQYQKAGIALSTALWVISVEQGVGKTLFGDLLRDLLGRPNTTTVNAAELKGDWNDWMVSKTLIVADEINVVEKKSFYATIKRWVGNPTVAIRKRNVGQWEVPATANWLFLTNDHAPIAIDAADRRHMFVEAQGDLGKAQAVIRKLQALLADPARRASAVSQVGAWLEKIPVDVSLISRAIPSAIKTDIIASTSSPAERWLKEAVESGTWRLGKALSSQAIWICFKKWAEHNGVYSGQIASNQFSTQLGVIAKRGFIESHRTKVQRGWRLVKVPPGVEPFQDFGLIDRSQYSSGMLKLRDLAARPENVPVDQALLPHPA